MYEVPGKYDFSPTDLDEPTEGGVEDTHTPDDEGVESCVDDSEETA